jgi:hypothetical protein
MATPRSWDRAKLVRDYPAELLIGTPALVLFSIREWSGRCLLGNLTGELRIPWAAAILNRPQPTTTSRRRNPLEWASDKVIKVTARVFHSPVLFGLLFSVSLVAVLLTPDREDNEG